MLYFIHGDPNKIFKKAQDMAESLLSKKPDASVFKINQDNFSEDKIEELLGGQGLFVNKYIVSVSRLLENKEMSDYLLNRIKDFKESDNIFIWVEEKVSRPVLKKIEKYSEKIQQYEPKTEQSKNKLDVFKIAELFAKKDKKYLWIYYNKLLKEVPAEEIYGILWWQAKSMLLASKTNNASEADMKEYPYKKAEGYAQKFTKEELEKISFDLINVYHSSRAESEDLALNMEKFILSY